MGYGGGWRVCAFAHCLALLCPRGPVAVLDPARVDFCVENVARLGLGQQEALDAPSDRFVTYVLLDGEAVLGGNNTLIEPEL